MHNDIVFRYRTNFADIDVINFIVIRRPRNKRTVTSIAGFVQLLHIISLVFSVAASFSP